MQGSANSAWDYQKGFMRQDRKDRLNSPFGRQHGSTHYKVKPCLLYDPATQYRLYPRETFVQMTKETRTFIAVLLAGIKTGNNLSIY